MQEVDRETSLFRDRFFIDFSWILGPILYEKIAKTIRGVSFFMLSLLRLQDRFWTVLGVDLASFFLSILVPNPFQNASKNRSKKTSNFESTFYRFLMDLGIHLGSHLAPESAISAHKGGQKEAKKAFQSELPKKLPKCSQNDPKMIPKTTPGAPIFKDFGTTFLTNLVKILRFFFVLVLGIRLVVARYLLCICLVFAW